MSVVVLSKTADCSANTVETVVNITAPTQFILQGKHPSTNAQIEFGGAIVANLSSSNPTYDAIAEGDYTVKIKGQCVGASVCIADIVDPPINIAPTSENSDVEIDCVGTTTQEVVNQRVSIVGAERPINVRLVEDCNPAVLQDYEIVCASTDGRLLILDVSQNPPVATEIDGSAIGDGATPTNCDVEFVTIDRCFQSSSDPSVRYIRVIVYPVGDPTSSTTVWFNESSGNPVGAPLGAEPCEGTEVCDIAPASGIVCYSTPGTQECGGPPNEWQPHGFGGSHDTTMYFNDVEYTVSASVAEPLTIVPEECSSTALPNISVPHPSVLTLDGFYEIEFFFSPSSLPVGEPVSLVVYNWAPGTTASWSIPPDSSTPEVANDARIFTWNDGSQLTTIGITLTWNSGGNGDGYLATQYGFLAGVSGEAFVFHDCDGNVTYRDTVTNDILVDPPVVPCDSGDSGGGPVQLDGVTPQLHSVTGVGVAGPGAHKYTVANVGGLAGIVDGVAFPPGATVTFEGYFDHYQNTWIEVNAVSYDATGTVFLIAETPRLV